MTSHKARNIFIILVCAIVALLALNYAAFRFIKQKTIAASELAVDTAAFDERQRQLFGSGPNDVVGEIATLNTHILGPEDPVSFIETIEARAKALGLSFEISSVAIDPATEETKENVTETLRLRFEAEGSWQEIMDFVFALEHLPYRVILEDVAFSQREALVTTGKKSVVTIPEWRLRAEITVLKHK